MSACVAAANTVSCFSGAHTPTRTNHRRSLACSSSSTLVPFCPSSADPSLSVRQHAGTSASWQRFHKSSVQRQAVRSWSGGNLKHDVVSQTQKTRPLSLSDGGFLGNSAGQFLIGPILQSSAKRVSKSGPIIAGRKGRRGFSRDNNIFGFAVAAAAVVVPLWVAGMGAVAAAVTLPTIAVAVSGLAVMSAITAVFAIIGPLLLVFVPIVGFPLALFFGLSGFGFGGVGGAVRTVFDLIMTLAITSNFVGALIGRAKRKRESDAEEEEVVPIGEQIRRMAMAEVEKSLQNMRESLPSQVGIKQKQKPVTKESLEQIAQRRANEAQEALKEVANAAWFTPTVVSLLPGLNGLAWFAAADAFPTAVQGPKRSAYVRNALVYGAPALLYLLAAPFQGLSLLGFLRGEAWWLSLVFGLVHLQLERKDMVEEARQRVAKTALPEPDEFERAARELREFDQQLSSVAWSKETPSKWTEANVGEWLRDEGLDRLVGTFAENHINGEVLLSLREEELRRELSIISLGDRKRVLAAIARLETKEREWDRRTVREFET